MTKNIQIDTNTVDEHTKM